MSDPIMDFHTHKDVALAIQYFKDAVTDRPEMGATPGFARQAAAFLWAIVTTGIMTSGELSGIVSTPQIEENRAAHQRGEALTFEGVASMVDDPGTAFLLQAIVYARVWTGQNSEGDMLAAIRKELKGKL